MENKLFTEDEVLLLATITSGAITPENAIQSLKNDIQKRMTITGVEQDEAVTSALEGVAKKKAKEIVESVGNKIIALGRELGGKTKRAKFE